ncbi:MAG TPA: WecB/TagA/CpsF family glycosyltransferase [Fimbriimonas sp.]|nr:WecB/TagA/CpsF family glycosyltransferase [Fimbriimonas sp.]
MTKTTTPVSAENRVQVLGVGIDPITMDECIARIAEFDRTEQPHLIVTADSSGIVQAQTDPQLMELYRSADLVTPDSVGVLWAAKRNGQPLPERVSGVDILERVCKRSSEVGWRIFLLGAAPGIAEQAAERLRLKYPGCNIVGTRHGYFPAESDLVVAAEIAEAKPDVLFVGMGIPRQEKFIRATQHVIGAKTSMGVGGSFDVFSGKVKRAPMAFRKMKLEWLWRLMQDPRKIGKVMLLPKFVTYVLRNGQK